MDFFEILPIILFVLFYLFGSVAKKKGKKEEERHIGGAAAPPKESLQDRLERALQDMQAKIDADDRPTGTSSPASGKPGTVREPEVRESFVRETAVREATVRESVAREATASWVSLNPSADDVANNIQRMSSQALYDHDKTDRTSASMTPLETFVAAEKEASLESRTADSAGGAYEYHSLLKNTPQAYHEQGIGEFHEAHGLHYGERPGTSSADSFRDEDREELHQALFGSPDDIRRAIVLTEVLDRPRSLRGR